MPSTSPPNGYRSGHRDIRFIEIDGATAAIVVGDMLSVATAGYYQKASAGEMPMCVAVDGVASPTTDGDVKIRADFSNQSVYEYPPDAGTVTQALVGGAMDVGGAQSVNIDAGTDDSLNCVDVDITANTVYVSLSTSAQRYVSVA